MRCSRFLVHKSEISILTTEATSTYGGVRRIFLPGMTHSCPPFKQRLHGSISVFASHLTLNFLQRAQARGLKTIGE